MTPATSALTIPALDVGDYIQGELASDIRHEYVAGEAYAMVGASDRHNLICLNLASAMHTHLRGGPCRVFMADMKVRVKVALDDYFYYPDVMVACRPEDNARYWREQPSLLVEVMSDSTARLDRREKWLVYQHIDALVEYLLLEQDRPEATLYRRPEGQGDWTARHLGPGDDLELASVHLTLPLAQLYEGLTEPT